MNVLTQSVFASGIVVVLLLALSPVTTGAQTIASNFWELRFKVKPGDTVYVTDDAGRERKARILDLSPSSLLLSGEGTRRNLGEHNVMRIRQRLPDPLLNGALTGAGAVMGLSIVSRIAFADDGGTFLENMGFIVYLGAIGAGVGTGIDALFQGRKIIYERPDSSGPWSLRISPALFPGRRGVRVSLTF